MVTSLGGFKRLPTGSTRDRCWIYLGTSVQGKARVESRLRLENRWKGAEAFRQIAEELRQPFLDFVAHVGAHQKDPIAWWSSRFSWKMWSASDLFLLTCYLGLAQRQIRQAQDQKVGLLLIVEDPWLFRQIKENVGRNRSNVHFHGSSGLAGEKVRFLFLGGLRRAWWLWKVAVGFAQQRRWWPSGKPVLPQQPAAAIFSVPQKMSLQAEGRWRDPYLPQLEGMLRELRLEVFRFSPPECMGFERELAERSGYFHPLILWASASGVVRSLLAFWHPRWPGELSVGDLPVRWLCFREWWLEIGRAGLCAYRMFYETLRGMLAKGQWRWLITFYENQPWEKLAVLAARERGVRVAGIQTAVLSRYYLPYLLGKGEASQMPLPDVICTSGPYAQSLLKQGGNPSDRLTLCGSIRYEHLTNGGRAAPKNLLPPAPRSKILVVLPIDLLMAEHLLGAVRAAFSDGGVGEGLRFYIRPHPMFPIVLKKVGFPAQVVPSSFADLRQALHECGLVLFTGSTVGFEAAAAGKTVLRYKSELLLDVDEVYGSSVPVCSESTLRESVLMLAKGNSATGGKHTQPIISQLFTPFNRERFKEILVVK